MRPVPSADEAPLTSRQDFDADVYRQIANVDASINRLEAIRPSVYAHDLSEVLALIKRFRRTKRRLQRLLVRDARRTVIRPCHLIPRLRPACRRQPRRRRRVRQTKNSRFDRDEGESDHAEAER